MDIIAIINHAMSLSNTIKSDCIKLTSLKKQSPLKIVVAFVCCCCVGCCIGLKFENWNEFQGFLAKMIQIAWNLKGNLTQIGGKLSVKGHGRWIKQLMIHWTSSVANFRPFWIVFAEFNLNIWVVGLNAALPFRNPIWPVCFDSVLSSWFIVVCFISIRLKAAASNDCASSDLKEKTSIRSGKCRRTDNESAVK